MALRHAHTYIGQSLSVDGHVDFDSSLNVKREVVLESATSIQGMLNVENSAHVWKNLFVLNRHAQSLKFMTTVTSTL